MRQLQPAVQHAKHQARRDNNQRVVVLHAGKRDNVICPFAGRRERYIVATAEQRRLLLAQTQEALARQEMLGAPPVLLVNHALRPLLSRFLRRSLNQLVVLSNMELSDNRHIRMTATIGGK